MNSIISLSFKKNYKFIKYMLLHTNYHLKSNLKQMHVELEPWIGRNCNKIKNDKRRIDHISVRAKLPILTPICAKFTEFILKHFY